MEERRVSDPSFSKGYDSPNGQPYVLVLVPKYFGGVELSLLSSLCVLNRTMTMAQVPTAATLSGKVIGLAFYSCKDTNTFTFIQSLLRTIPRYLPLPRSHTLQGHLMHGKSRTISHKLCAQYSVRPQEHEAYCVSLDLDPAIHPTIFVTLIGSLHRSDSFC